MERNSFYAKLMLILILGTAVLAACIATNDPSPDAPLAEVVAVSVERPSATATPQPSSTPTATMTSLGTAVPISTPQPTNTQLEPTPTFTPLPGGLIPMVSSQGQLAFVQNQVLLVETAVGSGIFNEFGSNIGSALWSPQGERLLFSTCTVPGQIFCEEPTWMLYGLKSESLLLLNDLISELPSGDLGNPTWMKSGDKILFKFLFEGSISVIDLDEETYSAPIHLFFVLYKWELPHENLLIQDHYGTWSNELHVYALDGTKLWSFPNPRPEFSSFEGANAGVLGLAIIPALHVTGERKKMLIF